MQVCEGVQHAHQKAIIHRDLKPSNVLVEEVDNKPVPKIIDFGLAKAMGQRLTEMTMFTEVGGVVGTPDYMSPEQADRDERNIDTRTDVYSLGVILYELLCGNVAFRIAGAPPGGNGSDVKAGHHGFGVHARFDELERHGAVKGFGLFRAPYFAHAALAQ
jgi:serine/threonine protein kinase